MYISQSERAKFLFFIYILILEDYESATKKQKRSIQLAARPEK